MTMRQFAVALADCDFVFRPLRQFRVGKPWSGQPVMNHGAIKRQRRKRQAAREPEASPGAGGTAIEVGGQSSGGLIENCYFGDLGTGIHVEGPADVVVRSPVMRRVQQPIVNRGGRVQVTNPDISAS